MMVPEKPILKVTKPMVKLEQTTGPDAARDKAFVPIGKPMFRGRLIARYKRFFADIELDENQNICDAGKVITAHCPNTGTMKTCGSAGSYVWVSHNPDPKRKLHYTWEYTVTNGGLVGVNTARPNHIVEAALAENLVPELMSFTNLRREVKYGKNSRIDILATSADGTKRCYVEVKNVTLLLDQAVAFPDAVTERGLKHLQELEEVVKAGDQAVAFFLINRPDGEHFSPAENIDLAWTNGLKKAIATGVQVLVYRAENYVDGSRLGERVNFIS